MSPKPIYVTQPYLPPLEEFIPYLEEIWSNKILTNCGPFHQRFEEELCDFLGVRYVSLFTNATIALITALQALRITGEVITTPYSFVATAHSLLWNGITPVFVDIEPRTLNLDPSKVERAITARTSAILPVHCYGYPCDVEYLKGIADNYGLKLIYDAAHAFGVRCHCGSILQHGDLSVVSFHATKVFNTFEGGAIVCADPSLKRRIDHLKNFGFVDETTVVLPGINGKMSEINAAFGALQLRHMRKVIEQRKDIDRRYREALEDLGAITCLPSQEPDSSNYSYFPILVGPSSRISRDKLYNVLRDNGVYARRYFFPLISEFPMYRSLASSKSDNLPIASKAAQEILCLPIYPALPEEEQRRIIALIREFV